MKYDDNNSLVGYVPALFYANMFTLYFLEIKERTKGGKTKAEEDEKIGFRVILTIFLYYIIIYIPIAVVSIIGDPVQIKFMFGMITNWY